MHHYYTVYLIYRPEPLKLEECSVYDLKDHPDFKFRPGSIVIRVLDCDESMAHSSSESIGQVLDNHSHTGKVLFKF